MREITGDLFDSGAAILAHGVNIRGAMAGGIAAAFARRWPALEWSYRQTCLEGRLRVGEVFYWQAPNGPLIANVATQDDPGPCARMPWLVSGLSHVLGVADGLGVATVAIPRIGCGIGGLSWKEVSWAIQQLEPDYCARFDVYSLP